MNSYDTLIISGGSVTGISMIGKLNKLINNNEFNLQTVKNFGGSSIGAVITFLLMIDYTPYEIFEYLLNSEMWNKFNFVQFFSIFSGKGVFSIEIFRTELKNLILKKLGKLPKFKDLEKNYFCCSVNLQTSKTVYFEKNNFPDNDVLESILMSCSIPILLEPYVFENAIYVDGGILDNFPINKAIELYNCKNILGLKSYQELAQNEQVCSSWTTSDFISLFFCSSIHHSNKQIENVLQNKELYFNLINIKTKYPFYKFNLKKEELINLFYDD